MFGAPEMRELFLFFSLIVHRELERHSCCSSSNMRSGSREESWINISAALQSDTALQTLWMVQMTIAACLGNTPFAKWHLLKLNSNKWAYLSLARNSHLWDNMIERRKKEGETELAFGKINHIGLVLSFWTHGTNLLVHLLNPEHHKYFSFAKIYFRYAPSKSSP